MQQKWYHASPRRFTIGKVITGVYAKTPVATASELVFYMPRGYVFFTSSEMPHYSIFTHAIEENWHVYQIEPLDPRIIYGDSWDEGKCLHAQVIKYIGSARGIAARHLTTISKKNLQKMASGQKKKYPQSYCGSYVTGLQVKRYNRTQKNRR